MALGMLNKNNQVKRRVQVSRGALPPRSGAGRHDSALRWLPVAVHLISGTEEAPGQFLDCWKYHLFVAFQADGWIGRHRPQFLVPQDPS